jgi:hypothetical protein
MNDEEMAQVVAGLKRAYIHNILIDWRINKTGAMAKSDSAL